MGRRYRFLLVIPGLLAIWGLVLAGATNPIDFRTFYAAGELLRTQPHALYSPSAQFIAQKAAGNVALVPWAHPAPESPPPSV